MRLLAPPTLVLGGSVRLVVLVDAKRPVPIEFVELQVSRSANVAVPPLNLRARLLGPGELAAGVTELPVRVDIPGVGPPSYMGSQIRVRHTATVHVSIPWWPDRRQSFALRVVQPEADASTAAPQLFSPHPNGPAVGQPSFECRMVDDTFLPGGVLTGTVALSNSDQVEYRGVTVKLMARESNTSQSLSFSGPTYRIELPIPKGGGSIPFRMKLPDDVEPTWLGAGLHVRWFLEVRVISGLGRDVVGRVPVVIAPAGSLRKQAPRAALPSVGDERVRRVWQVVAQQQGFELEDESLRARLGAAEVVIERERSGTARLVARVRFPSLRLDLDGGRKTGLRRVFAESVDMSGTPWGRACYATGRDQPQVAHVVGALAAAVVTAPAGTPEGKFERRVVLEDLEDDALVLSCADAGTTHTPLERFARLTRRVARAIPALRFEAPLPTGHEQAPPTWRAVTRALDARLETTHLGVAGHKDGVATEVRTLWDLDGQIRGVEVAVHAATPIDESRCFERRDALWLREPEEPLPEDAKVLLERLVEESELVEVTPNRLRALLGVGEGPEAALARLDRLLRLAAALRVAAGPYR